MQQDDSIEKLKAQGVYSDAALSPAYCYSVFMRHLAHLREQGGMEKIPPRVAEFGPGASLGVGLCALLAGADKFYGLDVIPYSNQNANLQLLEGLLQLFRARAPVPAAFPAVKPRVDDFSFPASILPDALLEQTLHPARIEHIRLEIRADDSQRRERPIKIEYIVPWENYAGEYPTVELILSQAVMEHVDNLDFAYGVMKKMLAPAGRMSHQIDFKSHGLTRAWNGHWAYSDTSWKHVRNRSSFLLNREPLSTHVALHERHGLKILFRQKAEDPSLASIRKDQLKGALAAMSDEDFATSGCYILSQKQ